MNNQSLILYTSFTGYASTFLRLVNIMLAAHHNNIGIAKLFCDIFCHAQAVAAAGIAVNYILAHIELLIKII